MKKVIFKIILLFLFASTVRADCVIPQLTSGFVDLGPLTSDTDFKTDVTSTTILKADVRISKNGGVKTATNSNQSIDGVADTGAPHNEIGVYRIRYNTTDSDTEGTLRFDVHKSGSLHAWTTCTVAGPNATIADIHNFPKDGVTNPASIGYWLITNADVPFSQHAITSLGIRTTMVSRSSQTVFSLTNGSPDNTGYPAGSLVVIRSQSVNERIAYGTVASYVGSTKTITLVADPGFTSADGDFVTIVPQQVAIGAQDSNVVSWNGTALPASDTPGYPKVTIKDGTGPGEISLSSGQINSVINITGALLGSVSGNILGNVNGSVGSVAAGGINAASFVANAINASTLDPTASAEFVTTLFGTAYEGAETFKDLLRYQASMLFRNYTSSGANYNFKDLTGTKNRVTYSSTPTSRTVTGKDATD